MEKSKYSKEETEHFKELIKNHEDAIIAMNKAMSNQYDDGDGFGSLSLKKNLDEKIEESKITFQKMMEFASYLNKTYKN